MENSSSQLKTNVEQKARGILAWLVKGCRSFRRQSAEPILQDFITARCVKADGLRERFGDLYRAYLDWHDANKFSAPMKKRLFMKLIGRQFKVSALGGNIFVSGIQLNGQWDVVMDAIDRGQIPGPQKSF